MDPVWFDPVSIGFFLLSAGAFAVSALFSTRQNRNVAAFMVIMWAATKVWNYKTGTDAQIYLDTLLALLCGLLSVYVMAKERRSKWPLGVLFVMVTWCLMNAAYSEPGRDYGPQVRTAYQIASNVLFGVALIVAAIPGARHGTLVVRRLLGAHPKPRPRPTLGAGWGREAPGAVSKRETKGR